MGIIFKKGVMYGGVTDWSMVNNRPDYGTGLSHEDYTSAEKTKLSDLPTATELDADLDTKVDKVTGKQLSTEDYTSAEKTKLGALPDAATLNADLANKADDSVVVKSVNTKTPTNGAVTVAAEDIEAEGIGDRNVSGNPINVNDAMASVAKGLSVELEPVQDLHGYANPWPAGGGKNLLPIDIAHMKTKNIDGSWSGNVYTVNGVTFTIEVDSAGNAVDIKVNGTASASITFYILSNMSAFFNSILGKTVILNGTPSGGSTSTYRMQLWSTSLGLNVDTGSGVTITVPSENESHNVVIIISSGYNASNLVFKPMLRLATESDASFVPYSNICPIYPAGYDSTYTHGHAEVKRTGKNLWNPDTSLIKQVSYRVGTNGNVQQRYGYEINVPPGTYSISAIFTGETMGSTYIYGGVYTTDGLRVTEARLIQNKTFFTPTLTVANGQKLLYFDGIETDGINTVRSIFAQFNIQLELGNQATEYEPYTGETAVIPFDTDVYGGQVDFVTGKCRVTHKYVDLGTLDYTYSSTYGFYATIADAKKVPSNIKADILCSAYETRTFSQIYSGYEGISARDYASSWTGIAIGDLRYSDAATFKTAMSGVQLVYELATPIELTLTPAQLTLLYGTNILTGDGTINLTYLGSMASNVQDEIDEFENGLNNVIGSIAFIENQTAKTSHAVGEYVILNGIFCKVIASISAGETLSFGTNIRATTIGAELRAIWGQLNA